MKRPHSIGEEHLIPSRIRQDCQNPQVGTQPSPFPYIKIIS